MNVVFGIFNAVLLLANILALVFLVRLISEAQIGRKQIEDRVRNDGEFR